MAPMSRTPAKNTGEYWRTEGSLGGGETCSKHRRRSLVTQRQVGADGVVQADVILDAGFQFPFRLEFFNIKLLCLQAAGPPFDHDVVSPASSAVHAFVSGGGSVDKNRNFVSGGTAIPDLRPPLQRSGEGGAAGGGGGGSASPNTPRFPPIPNIFCPSAKNSQIG